MDQKLQPPGLDRIEARPGRKREHAGILLTAKARRIGVVALHEAECAPVLNDPQPIEAIALGRAKIFGAENIVWPIGGDEDGLAAAWLLALVVLEFRQADEIAADRGWRE